MLETLGNSVPASPDVLDLSNKLDLSKPINRCNFFIVNVPYAWALAGGHLDSAIGVVSFLCWPTWGICLEKEGMFCEYMQLLRVNIFEKS